ncbi:MAG TPA: choice-of-anchor R domain-containing protein [Fimbriimonadaceae bacterium]|nr:choice-of-anchor R domain-containing protein [Fimbriimonadaceae bacterium]
MHKGHVSIALLIAGSVGLTTLARADAAFDNFTGNGFSYDLSDGWVVAGMESNLADGTAGQFASEQVADQFTAGLGGTLSEIDLAVDFSTTDPSQGVVATLYSDSGSNTLGTALGSWDVSSQLLAAGTPGSILAFQATGPQIELAKGSRYWVMLSGANASTVGSWRLADSGDSQRIRMIQSGMLDHYSQGDGFAFKVNVQGPAPTPEPITTGLAAAGLGLALLRMRRRV